MASGLKLYNTLTREKVDFEPIDPSKVRLYVCGPTVYDFAHIGNARPVIVFDVLYRLLRHVYGEAHVTYVRNITDVDDKINARALRDFPDLPLNEAIRAVTEKTESQFHSDVARLGCLKPDVEPRATDNIAQMIEIIVRLIDKGHAYVAAGEVLFDTRSMPDYGQLSKRNLDEQQAAPASPSMRTRRTLATSCCGSSPRITNRAGKAPGAAGVRAGISNAPPWPTAISGKRSRTVSRRAARPVRTSSTFMAAAST